ncbi:MAG: hypothetical protein M1828_000459 [Chrysothrix sp. TS-e1954]|nr:MAG: hypothetical protein M1828_000459 [Chrysothrix sp. TS-e1954]
MAPRLPARNDFPDSVTLTISPPPTFQAPTNVLILLHGLGDSHVPFQKLGKQLNLPETVTISLQAPTPLPFDLGGFHWGDDIVFDQAKGSMDVDTGFERATKLIGQSLIKQGLIEKCGYRPDEILLFGLGQGGMAALAASSSLSLDKPSLGGIVTIGGPLPISCAKGKSSKCEAPVLGCHGSSKSSITTSAVKALKESFAFVEVREWRRPGDGMPTNREEMFPIMQFFARRLRSRKGIPEEAIEVT